MRDCGCIVHPAFPTPSLLGERFMDHSGVEPSRECRGVFLSLRGESCDQTFSGVMPGLVPGIHVLCVAQQGRGWPGRRPAMTLAGLERVISSVIARSETTKQSSFLAGAKMDCFASTRNDGMGARCSFASSWPGSAKPASRDVPAIHVLPFHQRKDVDARHKAGHDAGGRDIRQRGLDERSSLFLIPPSRSVG